MDSRDRGALSRRAFVGKVATKGAAGVAALALTRGAAQAALAHREEPRSEAISPQTGAGSGGAGSGGAVEALREISETAPAPWQLLRPLAVGSAVTPHWKVVELTGVRAGACALTLENDNGRQQRLHICRNDGRPHGLVYTARFDLVAMNGGRGDMPTEESFGQAVAEIAHVIARNEVGHGEVAGELLPQRERERQFASTARLR